MPYWDATHDRDLPRWVKNLRPRGGTVIVPEGLPPGHAGFGLPVGSRYPIDFGRFPNTSLGFQQRHPPTRSAGSSATTVSRLLPPIDLVPEVVEVRVPAALQALDALAVRLPDNPDVQLLVAFIETPPAAMTSRPRWPPQTPSWASATRQSEAAKPRPDRELIRLILTMYSAFVFPPLSRWPSSGGLNPHNPNLSGTVTYFNELAVDPVFWMLHGELDRFWYTWETPTPTWHSSRVRTGCCSRSVPRTAAGTAAGAPTPSTSSSITKQWPTPTTRSTPCEWSSSERLGC